MFKELYQRNIQKCNNNTPLGILSFIQQNRKKIEEECSQIMKDKNLDFFDFFIELCIAEYNHVPKNNRSRHIFLKEKIEFAAQFMMRKMGMDHDIVFNHDNDVINMMTDIEHAKLLIGERIMNKLPKQDMDDLLDSLNTGTHEEFENICKDLSETLMEMSNTVPILEGREYRPIEGKEIEGKVYNINKNAINKNAINKNAINNNEENNVNKSLTLQGGARFTSLLAFGALLNYVKGIDVKLKNTIESSKPSQPSQPSQPSKPFNILSLNPSNEERRNYLSKQQTLNLTSSSQQKKTYIPGLFLRSLKPVNLGKNFDIVSAVYKILVDSADKNINIEINQLEKERMQVLKNAINKDKRTVEKHKKTIEDNNIKKTETEKELSIEKRKTEKDETKIVELTLEITSIEEINKGLNEQIDDLEINIVENESAQINSQPKSTSSQKEQTAALIFKNARIAGAKLGNYALEMNEEQQREYIQLVNQFSKTMGSSNVTTIQEALDFKPKMDKIFSIKDPHKKIDNAGLENYNILYTKDMNTAASNIKIFFNKLVSDNSSKNKTIPINKYDTTPFMPNLLAMTVEFFDEPFMIAMINKPGILKQVASYANDAFIKNVDEYINQTSDLLLSSSKLEYTGNDSTIPPNFTTVVNKMFEKSSIDITIQNEIADKMKEKYIGVINGLPLDLSVTSFMMGEQFTLPGHLLTQEGRDYVNQFKMFRDNISKEIGIYLDDKTLLENIRTFKGYIGETVGDSLTMMDFFIHCYVGEDLTKDTAILTYKEATLSKDATRENTLINNLLKMMKNKYNGLKKEDEVVSKYLLKLKKNPINIILPNEELPMNNPLSKYTWLKYIYNYNLKKGIVKVPIFYASDEGMSKNIYMNIHDLGNLLDTYKSKLDFKLMQHVNEFYTNLKRQMSGFHIAVFSSVKTLYGSITTTDYIPPEYNVKTHKTEKQGAFVNFNFYDDNGIITDTEKEKELKLFPEINSNLAINSSLKIINENVFFKGLFSSHTRYTTFDFSESFVSFSTVSDETVVNTDMTGIKEMSFVTSAIGLAVEHIKSLDILSDTKDSAKGISDSYKEWLGNLLMGSFINKHFHLAYTNTGNYLEKIDEYIGKLTKQKRISKGIYNSISSAIESKLFDSNYSLSEAYLVVFKNIILKKDELLANDLLAISKQKAAVIAANLDLSIQDMKNKLNEATAGLQTIGNVGIDIAQAIAEASINKGYDFLSMFPRIGSMRLYKDLTSEKIEDKVAGLFMLSGSVTLILLLFQFISLTSRVSGLNQTMKIAVKSSVSIGTVSIFLDFVKNGFSSSYTIAGVNLLAKTTPYNLEDNIAILSAGSLIFLYQLHQYDLVPSFPKTTSSKFKTITSENVQKVETTPSAIEPTGSKIDINTQLKNIFLQNKKLSGGFKLMRFTSKKNSRIKYKRTRVKRKSGMHRKTKSIRS